MIDYLRHQAMIKASVFAKNNRGKDTSEFSYTSTEDYLLDRGWAFAGAEPLSDEQFAYLTSVANHVRTVEAGRVFAPKQCFDNSMVMVLSDAEDRLAYCEGFALTGLFPVHHAWLELDGKIVDLTRSLRKEAVGEFLEGKPPQDDLRDRVLGVLPAGWQYFGVSFQHEAVRDYVYELEQTGSLIEDWDRRFPLWKEARLGNEPAPDPGAWDLLVKTAAEVTE